LPSKQGGTGDRKGDANNKKEKKYEPAAPPTRVGKKQRKQKGPEAAARLPVVTPATKCKLRLLKLDRVKDYLLMEEEFVAGQERLKPQEDKNEEDRSKVDDLRGSPMSVGNLEEIIDENHAIVSSSVGPEYYVNILSFVDKDQLEPGCAILMHNKVFVSFYLVHIAFEKQQWWPGMFARTFLSLPLCCCNCACSCPHDGKPKHLGAMESSISHAIGSCVPIEGRNYLGSKMISLLEARGQWTF
jgi:hypothetical protein